MELPRDGTSRIIQIVPYAYYMGPQIKVSSATAFHKVRMW